MKSYDVATAISIYIYAVCLFIMVIAQMQSIPRKDLILNKISQHKLYFLSYSCLPSIVLILFSLHQKEMRYSPNHIILGILYVAILTALLLFYDKKTLQKVKKENDKELTKTPFWILITTIFSCSLSGALTIIWFISFL